MRLFFSVALIFCGASTLFAQNISSLKTAWYSSMMNDTNSNIETAVDSKFVFDGQNEILWIQKGGLKTYTFSVSSTTGEWTDSTLPGEISYNGQINGKQGTIVVGRSANNLFIRLEYSKDELTTMSFQFSIERMEIL